MEKDSVFKLSEIAKLSPEKVLKKLGADFQTGLTYSQVETSRVKYGDNKLTSKKVSRISLLISAFNDPFTILLFIIALISLFTDYIAVEDGSLSSFFIIMVILLSSGILQYVQEVRSHVSAEELAKMVRSSTTVIREGKEQMIPTDNLVVGDLVTFASGDLVPADIRLLKSTDLFVGQSSLTGESEPVGKSVIYQNQKESSITDLDNIVYMGTNVISGAALGIVINIGKHTVLGGIAKSLDEKPVQTSFDKELHSISWILIRLMLVVVPVVFVAQGVQTKDWLTSFIFAITVAVGLTPAMLPTVVSVNLAKNGNDLSKKKVIVKALSATQNLGSMNILCTDKTGTLTKDKVTLMHVYNPQGEESSLVAKYAYLNSYYQTGLRNLLDEAVINYSQHNHTQVLASEYHKVNEIPFDFTRRRMSVAVRSQDRNLLLTKGALEEILGICDKTHDGDIVPLSQELRLDYQQRVSHYNQQGLRVVALAIREFPVEKLEYSIEDEQGMTLLGFLAFLDPPKESAKHAVEALHNQGVEIKVLTGDNSVIARKICQEVGIPSDIIVSGAEIDSMPDQALTALAKKTSVFSKLSPNQKHRIVRLLQIEGNIVGYMGDGINDASSLRQADVGISVDTGADIAKESSNIILLEKDLTVLSEGINLGRKAQINIMKYVKTTISINFGYMLTMLISSFLLPFFPMLPIQLLIFNLIYDISSLGVPWDNVDKELLQKPSARKALSLNRFMVSFGPITSIADMATFLLLFFVLIPSTLGAKFSPANASSFAALFQTSWFVSSLWTQFIFIHLVRTPKVPFIKSHASKLMLLLSLTGPLIGTILPYILPNKYMGTVRIPTHYYAFFLMVFTGYTCLTLIIKWLYIKRYKEFI